VREHAPTSTPVSTPDTKDWTWVLERPCPECGFSATLTPGQIGPRLRAAVAQLASALDSEQVRTRPAPDTWSPLEYACHVRDVCRIFRERLALMLTEDDPAFANWDQDATAVADDYNSQEPQVVLGELLTAAELLAQAYSAVPDTAWERTGRRSDGARFTVLSLGRYLVHDPAHHAWDVTGLPQT
jgi:hypothetical protein